MGHIYRKVLTVNESVHHQDVARPEIVTLLLALDPLDRASLECERNRLAVKEGEHLRLIKQSHVHTTSVRSVIMHDLVVRLCDLRIHHEILKHETVLDLRHSEQSVPGTVLLLHSLDHLGHILKLLLILGLGPLVLSFGKELRIIFHRVIIDVEEILQIVESYHIALFTLLLSISSGAEQHQSRQNN